MVMAAEISVLVVDDDILIRLDLVDYLHNEGFRVFEAGDADAAIAILEANPGIHILLTDVDMPGSMDGLKLSAAVRNRWPPVRIVVTSGHRIVAATDLPAGGLFFSKPYAPETLARSLRDLVIAPGG
ncbi:MAG: response regulator [Rhizobiales bacterium]|nr:response regulator [Hyphomicrobiales bacterium]